MPTSEETGAMDDLLLDSLAAFAGGGRISPVAQERLETAGFVEQIPAVTAAGRTALEDHGRAPAEWGREE